MSDQCITVRIDDVPTGEDDKWSDYVYTDGALVDVIVTLGETYRADTVYKERIVALKEATVREAVIRGVAVAYDTMPFRYRKPEPEPEPELTDMEVEQEIGESGEAA